MVDKPFEHEIMDRHTNCQIVQENIFQLFLFQPLGPSCSSAIENIEKIPLVPFNIFLTCHRGYKKERNIINCKNTYSYCLSSEIISAVYAAQFY